MQAHAWEADVHYGLIKWLAVQAGFTLADAEIVAAASEAPDESDHLSATGVSVPDICPWGRTEASRHVQLYHFPSGAFPPDRPSNRAVTPGDANTPNGANRWVRQEIGIGWGQSPIDRRAALYRFGMALHPLADSWSHQGTPGIAKIIAGIGCPDDTGWGHPDLRGGPYVHDADLTYLHKADTLATARTIYHYMREFLAAHALPPGDSAQGFAMISGDVEEFARQGTKSGKYVWFKDKQNKVVPYASFSTYPCFLTGLSIPNGDDSFAPPIPCAEPQPGPQSGNTVQPGPQIEGRINQGAVGGFLDDFLTRWIVKRDYQSVAADFANWDAVRTSLLGQQASIVSKNYGEGWQRAILEMWLVRDHGAVNKLGHGLANKDGVVPLIRIVSDLRKIDGAKTISDAIGSVHGSGPYDLYPLPGNRGYMVTFKFKHIAEDVLVLQAVPQGQRWRISGFGWLAQ